MFSYLFNPKWLVSGTKHPRSYMLIIIIVGNEPILTMMMMILINRADHEKLECLEISVRDAVKHEFHTPESPVGG